MLPLEVQKIRDAADNIVMRLHAKDYDAEAGRNDPDYITIDEIHDPESCNVGGVHLCAGTTGLQQDDRFP